MLFTERACWVYLLLSTVLLTTEYYMMCVKKCTFTDELPLTLSEFLKTHVQPVAVSVPYCQTQVFDQSVDH